MLLCMSFLVLIEFICFSIPLSTLFPARTFPTNNDRGDEANPSGQKIRNESAEKLIKVMKAFSLSSSWYCLLIQ